MNRDVEEQACLFALDMLEEDERIEFEQRLAQDEKLRNLVNQFCRNTVDYAESVLAIQSPSPEAWQRIEKALQECSTSSKNSTTNENFSGRVRWLSWNSPLWAAAALVAFGIHFWWAFQTGKGTSTLEHHIESSSTALEADPNSEELDRLQAENRLLRSEKDYWESNYQSLESRLADLKTPRTEKAPEIAMEQGKEHTLSAKRESLLGYLKATRGIGKFTVIDLFAAGQSEEGIDISDALTDQFNLGRSPGPSNTENESGKPIALMIWDEESQEGILEVRNLPEPDEGSHYRLWMRSQEETDYVPVGNLLEAENGSLSVSFDSPEYPFSPLEVLVTEETAPSEQPSGKVVLIGPQSN